MDCEPPSIVTVEAAAKTLRRIRHKSANTRVALRAPCATLSVPPMPLKRESYIGKPELERRSTPWYRKWFGPFGFEVRNYTKYFARVVLRPQPHTGPSTDLEVDVGVTGLGNLGLKTTKEVYGDVHGNDIYLEPRGNDETTGYPRQNRQLVRVETKEVYATVLLLDTESYRWVCVIPAKKVSSHYNFNILDHYGRMMSVLRGPPTTSSTLHRRSVRNTKRLQYEL